ncbi:D-dopachrome decarboxylase-A-like isoform 1-T1 [Salvelinus alpinus]|uniref:D-dopachrome decarboxylase-A isoform X1 n=1 Tax=Salvelinus sp. IW2-2015 TaxID=2691554 RepID=UPI0038D492D0
MPFIDLESNLPESTFSEDFLKKLCSKTAAVLGKPEEVLGNTYIRGLIEEKAETLVTHICDQLFQKRMMLVVKPGLPMLMGGTCAPCVILSVSAIGVTDTAEKNKEHSANIFPFLTGELGLTEDRVMIRFYALEPHQVGKKGTVMSYL